MSQMSAHVKMWSMSKAFIIISFFSSRTSLLFMLCFSDSFSSIWHPWEINDLTAVYYFLSNKYYNSEYTLQPSLNKLHFNLSDDTKFWLGYKNMLSGLFFTVFAKHFLWKNNCAVMKILMR